MYVSLIQLKDFLAEEGSEFIHLNSKNNIEKYSLASLRNIIDYGIYFIDSHYSKEIEKIQKSIIITNLDVNEYLLKNSTNSNSFIFSKSPQLTFYKLGTYIKPPKVPVIHSTAIIDKNAVIGKNVSIGAYSIIGSCAIGDNCNISPHVVVHDNVQIGKNTTVEPNSYIGATGVAWVWEGANKIVQPQFGGVVIGDDCFIGSDVSIVRGSVNENTIIGNNTLIAHGSKIGHGVIIGSYSHLANNVSIAGNCEVGKNSFLGSACVLSSHIKLGENCIVGAGAVVANSFLETNLILIGVPAKSRKEINPDKKLNGIPLKT